MPDNPTNTILETPKPALTAKDLIPDWVGLDGRKTAKNAKERNAKAEIKRRQEALQALIDRNAELEGENTRLQGQVNDFKGNRAVEKQILDAATHLPGQLLLKCAAGARVFSQIQALAEEEGGITFGLNAREDLVATVVNRLGTFTMTLSGQGNWIHGLLEVDNNLVSARAKQKFQPPQPEFPSDPATEATSAALEQLGFRRVGESTWMSGCAAHGTGLLFH